MTELFKLYTYTPWDGLKPDQIVEVKLLSLKSLLKSYPVIEKKFFVDLMKKLKLNENYSWFETIRRIVGPNEEDYRISSWRFIWALDMDNRMYQFLIQKTGEDNKLSKATMVALAPPELGRLISDYGSEAIQKTLNLLNNPSKLKFLIYLSPKGKSIAEEANYIPVDKRGLEKLSHFQNLMNQPNVKGNWFPTFELRCPNCNNVITGVKDFRIDFSKFTCPFCGYKRE